MVPFDLDKDPAERVTSEQPPCGPRRAPALLFGEMGWAPSRVLETPEVRRLTLDSTVGVGELVDLFICACDAWRWGA